MEPTSAQTQRGRETSARLALPARKAQARQAARARIARATTAPLTKQQKALDPLNHKSRTGAQAANVMAWLLAALLLHASVVGVGVLLGRTSHKAERQMQDIAIEVREPPPPPPPPPEPEPEPEAEVAAEPEPTPPKQERPPKPERLPPAPPPKAEPPPPPESKPPPRVVGLSLDSTTEGGEGPAFAVGNTREGRTADKAADPNKVAAVGTGPIVENPSEAPNRAATRIPTVGLVFTPAKRKQPSNPPYPETLKSQGIEGDVTVMVSINAEGKVTSVKIVKPAPYPEFNDLAKQTALTEAYEPAAKNGVAVNTTITFTYRWRLEEP